MARRVARRAARDFVLDAHGLTALAAPTPLASEWLDYIYEEHPGSEIWVPAIILAESTTGSASDHNVNRFLKTLEANDAQNRHCLATDETISRRAGTLRTLALQAAGRGRRISATDAVVAAHAEALSERRGVTIVTSDPGDLQLLVDQTSCRNVAVQAVNAV